jgi:hypothetical protein
LAYVYALPATIVLVGLTNHALFRSFYGKEFRGRFSRAQASIREMMLQSNKEMEEKHKSSIEVGEEPRELVEFGELWRKRLAVMNTLNAELKRMDGHVVFIYYMLMLGLLNSFLFFVYPGALAEVAGLTVTAATVGWAFTFFTSGMLVLYQFSYRRLAASLGKAEASLQVPP